jgi:hypothetical protein
MQTLPDRYHTIGVLYEDFLTFFTYCQDTIPQLPTPEQKADLLLQHSNYFPFQTLSP